MKAKYWFTGIVFLMGSPAYAAGQGSSYVGAQYALVTYDEEGFDDVEPTALVGRLGHFVNDNVAIEGRIGLGLQDDEVEVDLGFLGTVDVEVEVENLFGIYAAIHSSSSSDTSFYGIFGFTQGELEASALGIDVSEDESGFSYGFGLNINKFNIEYMSYLDEDDFEVTAISLGFVNEFD